MTHLHVCYIVVHPINPTAPPPIAPKPAKNKGTCNYIDSKILMPYRSIFIWSPTFKYTTTW